MEFFETSAKTGNGVEDAFNYIADEVVETKYFVCLSLLLLLLFASFDCFLSNCSIVQLFESLSC